MRADDGGSWRHADAGESHGHELIAAPRIGLAVEDQVERAGIVVDVAVRGLLPVGIRRTGEREACAHVNAIVVAAANAAVVDHSTATGNAIAVDQQARALTACAPSVIPR